MKWQYDCKYPKKHNRLTDSYEEAHREMVSRNREIMDPETEQQRAEDSYQDKNMSETSDDLWI